MIRALHLLCLLLFCIPLRAQQPLVPEVPFETGARQADLDTLAARLVRRIAARPAVWADAVRHAETTDGQGGWSDVDYSLDAAGFPVLTHLRRMVLLARAYTEPRSPLCGRRAVKERLMAAFDRYLRWYAADPRIDNWWYRDIGAPQEYAAALLLLTPALERAEVERLAEYVRDGTVHWAHRGKNRTWVSTISLMKACALGDVPLAERAIASMASTADFALRQGDEGFKFDMSIHQHRPQVYSGGYGMSLVGDLADFIGLTHGTAFRALFTPEKCALLTRALLDGTRLFGYRGAIDFGVIGRGISRPGNCCNIDPEVLDRMAENDPAHAADFGAWRAHIVDSAPFPAPGNKHFWCSDIMTHHGADYYLSVKIPSTRTVGTEQLNRENLRGFNLPLGATNILTHGREYFDVFPLWDWTKVPGVTALACEDSTHLEGYLFGKNEFGGGVSDGRSGVMAFEYDYRGLKGRKAYFLFGDRMLCLGCGIASQAPHRVTTTLNQCFLNGEVSVWEEGTARSVSAGRSERLAAACRIWHDGVAYLVPAGDLRLETRERSGAWSDLAEELPPASTPPVSGRLFTLWLDHGASPSGGEYRYVVVPGVSREAAGGLPSDGGFEVVRNTPEQQIVHDAPRGLSAVVFYRPGEAVLPGGLRITADKRMLLLVARRGDGLTISYSDPLCYQREAVLTVNRALSGPGAEACGTTTRVRVQFPQYPDFGRTVTIELNNPIE